MTGDAGPFRERGIVGEIDAALRPARARCASSKRPEAENLRRLHHAQGRAVDRLHTRPLRIDLFHRVGDRQGRDRGAARFRRGEAAVEQGGGWRRGGPHREPARNRARPDASACSPASTEACRVAPPERPVPAIQIPATAAANSFRSSGWMTGLDRPDIATIRQQGEARLGAPSWPANGLYCFGNSFAAAGSAAGGQPTQRRNASGRAF